MGAGIWAVHRVGSVGWVGAILILSLINVGFGTLDVPKPTVSGWGCGSAGVAGDPVGDHVRAGGRLELVVRTVRAGRLDRDQRAARAGGDEVRRTRVVEASAGRRRRGDALDAEGGGVDLTHLDRALLELGRRRRVRGAERTPAGEGQLLPGRRREAVDRQRGDAGDVRVEGGDRDVVGEV